MTSNLDPADELFAIRNQIAGSLSRVDENGFVQTSGEFLQRITAYLDTLSHAGEGEPGTPAAQWRVEGKPDPHGNLYGIDVERSRLCRGDLTDDALANEVYLDPNIGNLTAAKERIRWLSRQLTDATPAEGERVSVETLRHECAANGPCSDYIDGCSCTDAELQTRHARALSKPAPQAEGVSEAPPWVIEISGLPVATIQPNDFSILEISKPKRGGYVLTIHSRTEERSHWEDISIDLSDAQFASLRALARPVDKGEGAPE